MSAVPRLIKAKTISFTEELLSNYKKIRLNEVRVVFDPTNKKEYHYKHLTCKRFLHLKLKKKHLHT